MNSPVNTYPIKDTKIKLFLIEHSNTLSGEVLKKKYQHPEDKVIHAYVRQLSATESSYGNAKQDGSSYLFVISKRAATSEMYIEVMTGRLAGLTFQIDAPDCYELRSNEIKLFAHQVSPLTYTEIEYGEWLK